MSLPRESLKKLVEGKARLGSKPRIRSRIEALQPSRSWKARVP